MADPHESVTLDRLEWLLKNFALRANAFHAGTLTCESVFEARPGVGYLHVLQEGAIALHDAGQSQREISEPSVLLYLNPLHSRIEPLTDSTRILCATFEFGLGSGNPLQAALPNAQRFGLSHLPGLDHSLKQVIFECTEPHCGRQSVLDRLCEIVLVLVLRHLLDNSVLDVGLLAGLADAQLQKALTAMHGEPDRNWSLVDLAAVAGMSRARFATKFRDTVGTTPVVYLTQWRLGLVKSRLLAGKSVSVIASEVGYSSASALSRAFQASFNQAPIAWLQSHKGTLSRSN